MPHPTNPGQLKQALWNLSEEVDLSSLTTSKSSFTRIPALKPSELGDLSFLADYQVKNSLVAGAMANGIASEDLVEAMAAEGMLAIFGAAGLSPTRVEQAIDRLQNAKGTVGFNLIHSPNEPELEKEVANLYIRRGVNVVEASAFLGLTLPIVKYSISGLKADSNGQVVATHRVIAKVSRREVAEKFLSPAPEAMVQELLSKGEITHEQAEWAKDFPVASDITAEADSGGHTDSRPALSLFPIIVETKNRIEATHNYRTPIRVGAAGGLGTPQAIFAAYAMGAAYVVTGSVNQACLESGSSEPVRKMLADARQGDFALAPAADMFEIGAKVQVLKRGTMFPMRANKLHALYTQYSAWHEVPATEQKVIEEKFLRSSFDQAWQSTCTFFETRDPAQIAKAQKNPKHQMALVFRSYLGQASHWANRAEAGRQIDYQVWCGPAMGAFNEWALGTPLEKPENRKVATVSLNLMWGAAIEARLQLMRSLGYGDLLKGNYTWVPHPEIKSIIHK